MTGVRFPRFMMLSLLLLASPLLSACGGKLLPKAGNGETAAGANIQLGTNALGEDCRLISISDDKGVHRYNLMCGTWEEPSGVVVSTELASALPEEAQARRTALEGLQASTNSTLGLANDIICSDRSWIAAPVGGEALMSSCALRSGGWPNVAVAQATDDKLYVVRGIPAVTDLLLRAPALLQTGAGAKAANTWRETELGAIQRLEASLGADAFRFGQGDLGAYGKFIELARMNNGVENYAAAEAAYRKALDIQTRALGPKAPALGATLLSLALEVSNQGRHDEAEALFRRAEPFIQASFDKTLQSRLSGYRGVDAGIAGKSAQALAMASEAAAISRGIAKEMEPDEGMPMSAESLGNLPSVRADVVSNLMEVASQSLRLNQTGAAEVALLEGKDFYNRTRGLPPWWRGRLLALEGQILARKGKAEEGIDLLRRAIQSQRKLFGDSWPVVSRYLELGTMQANYGHNADGVNTFRAAITMITTLDSANIQLPFERIAPFLDAAVTASERRPAEKEQLAAEMFEAVQLVRSGVVGQTISRASARLATDDPKVADLVRRQQDVARERDKVRLQLADEQAKPDQSRDKKVEDQLSAVLGSKMAESKALERELQAAFPGYARLTRFQAVKASQISTMLGEDEALVSFAFAASRSFGFLVTREGLVAFRVDLSAQDLSDAVRELRTAFMPVDGRLAPYDLALANVLYTKLLGPIEATLAGKKRLVVVPDGALTSLPPALLVTSPTAAPGDYSRAAWLMRRHAVAVAPSIAAFVTLRKLEGRAPAPRPFAGFANPPFEGKRGKPAAGGGALEALGQECRTGAPADPALLRALDPLPETADEIRKVSAVLGGGSEATITGAAVTKKAVREAGLEQYRVVYFATHGLLPGELRCQSEPGLALSPPQTAPATPADDGLLTASDVATLRLKADLVVLSACNTAGGGGRFGGGALSGLAEAFFYAGARGMLVTHWQVPSGPTVSLTTGLFERLSRSPGLQPPEALGATQAELAASPATSHPFFWGAFTLVGDGRMAARTP